MPRTSCALRGGPRANWPTISNRRARRGGDRGDDDGHRRARDVRGIRDARDRPNEKDGSSLHRSDSDDLRRGRCFEHPFPVARSIAPTRRSWLELVGRPILA